VCPDNNTWSYYKGTARTPGKFPYVPVAENLKFT